MLKSFLLMIIVYLDCIIFFFKTNALGSTYHDTEYCADDDFRMKSFCGMTIHKKTLYTVNTELG